MIGKIRYIADFVSEKYEACTFARFYDWFLQQKRFQFDVETTVSDWWDELKIISMQFGSAGYQGERCQWFLQWSELSDIQKKLIKKVLENQHVEKIIHRASFEYVVCRFHDIIIENVYDTMVIEKVLMGGLELENYALADISWKYLSIQMDKTLQMAFGDNIITDAKIRYAITDVAYLDVIRAQQMAKGDLHDLLYVFGLENDAVLAFSEITYHGMVMDKEKWRENLRLAKPIVKAAKEKLDGWLNVQPFKNFAIAKGYIAPVDRLFINVNAHAQKNELIKVLFPDIPGSAKPVLKKYIRDNGKHLNMTQMDILTSMHEGKYKPFEKELTTHHREYLVDHEYLVPADTVTLNWNSPTVLELMQLVEPRLNGLGEEEINKVSHKACKDLQEYKKKLKMLSSFGEAFLEKYVGPDGRVRTHFNQVVSTGRVSSANPNMQNIIVTDEVGTRYRNAFVYLKGWKFVDSDFASQELVLIAYISQDPVWMECIRKGQDLHSVAAELVYGYKWKEAAQVDCAYYQEMYYDGHQWMSVEEMQKLLAEGYKSEGQWKRMPSHMKCNCKKHKTMRYDCKTINFGLAYGMSEIKLSGELDISVREAKKLIETYFRAFPAIGRTLGYLGEFGVRYGYIQTLAPFFRKRWFPYWSEYRPWIEAHIQGIKYVPPLGEIERASKNQPIQGSGADMMKVAMVLVRNYIRDNNLWDMVHMVAQVHDQLTTCTPDTFAEAWAPILDKLMCDAGKVIIPTGILKADTNITSTWTK